MINEETPLPIWKQKKNQNKNGPKDLKVTLKENMNLILELVEEVQPQQIKKVLNIIKKSEEKQLSKDEVLQKLNHKSDKQDNLLKEYLNEFTVLANKGYENPQMILKSLKKNEGNLEKAEEFLQKKKENEEKKNQKNEYKNQYKYLLQQDIPDPLLIKKALKIAQGDQEKALELLKNPEESMKKPKKERPIREKKERKERPSKEKKEKPYKKYLKQGKNSMENEDEFEVIKSQLEQLKLEAISDQINTIFLDGNNCFFINSAMRKAILERKAKGKVELAIVALAREFMARNKHLKKFVVIYDNTNLSIQESDFVVESAMPRFKTSDDYLVELCQKDSGNQGSSVLFVSSDVGLQKRLIDAGAKNLMKSGKFFDEIQLSLSESRFDQIVQEKLA